VGAVGGAEGVVDIEVAVGGQGGGEVGVVLLFAGVEADVLQQGHAAVLHGVDHLGGGRADAVAGEGHLLLQQLAQRLGDEGQAHLRHDLALGAVEVGQQDDLGALCRQVVDGRQGRAQAGVVGDLAAVDRHVEVHPDQGALAGEIGGVEGAEGHGRPPEARKRRRVCGRSAEDARPSRGVQAQDHIDRGVGMSRRPSKGAKKRAAAVEGGLVTASSRFTKALIRSRLLSKDEGGRALDSPAIKENPRPLGGRGRAGL
jgi:hypothetical protein